MKPKKMYRKSSSTYDECMTPYWALEPLREFIGSFTNFLEPASGNGNIVRWLWTLNRNLNIKTNDIGQSGVSYLDYDYSNTDYDLQITNPPFSIKFYWLEKALSEGKPFILFYPFETISCKTYWDLIDDYKHDIGYLIYDKRIGYHMPYRGYQSSAQMESCILMYNTGLKNEQIIRRSAQVFSDKEWEEENGFTRTTRIQTLSLEKGWQDGKQDQYCLLVEKFKVDFADNIGRTVWYPNYPPNMKSPNKEIELKQFEEIKEAYRKYGDPK